MHGNTDVLSLTAEHPTARIDTSTADYEAAQARLIPDRVAAGDDVVRP